MEQNTKFATDMRKSFQAESDEELILSFNKEVGNKGWVSARAIYLDELKKEFIRREWDFSEITNESGGFNLGDGNQVYLSNNRLNLLSGH